MVKWVLHRRELLLIPGGKDGMQQVIAWDGSGKADEECECRKVVEGRMQIASGSTRK